MTSILALLLAACFGDGPNVRLTASAAAGGSVTTGKLAEASEIQIILDGPTAQQTFDTSDVDSIAFLSSQNSPPQPVVATLIDGSRLSIAQIRTDGRVSALSLYGNDVKIASNLIASVQLGDLTEEQQATWRGICQAELSSDVLVVRRAAGKLERIEGIILGAGESGVEFDLSGATVTVPYNRLAGMRMYSAQESEALPIVASVTDSNNSRLPIAKLRLPPDSEVLFVTLPCGAELPMPLTSVLEIDFKSSRSLGLQELDAVFEPAEAPLGITLASTADLMPRITNVRLPDSTRAITCLTFFGGGSATYRIPAGFQQLTGALKLNSRKAGTDCRVRIFVDSDAVFDTTLRPGAEAIDFNIPVHEDQRLQLRVDATSPIPTGATVVFQSPTLLK